MMRLQSICSAVIIAVVFTLSQWSLAAYSGGSGTSGDPYKIGSAEDWLALTNTPDDWRAGFILISNIDLANVIFQPVGTFADPFIGTFDGDGHTIRNASIDWSEGEYVGLFGRVGSAGQIRNLGIANITIWGGAYAGGLVGSNEGSVSHCFITGSVHGYYVNTYIGNHGGLAGKNSGYITNCGVIVDVDGHTAGGLVGFNDNYGQLTNCYARGNVTGWPVGGLVGYHYTEVEMNYAGIGGCYATGLVTTLVPSSDYNGGLTGYGWCGAVSGFWDIETTGQATTSGGGTGKTTAQMKTMTTFSDAGWDFTDTWIGWDPPQEHYPELNLPLGPFTLTIQTSPSNVTSTIPSPGQFSVYGPVQISAEIFTDCPNRYRFDHWEGDVDEPLSFSTTLFVDAPKTVTAVFTLIPPACGDACHPYPTMDFSHNCRVDVADLAIFAAHWMDCTDPQCD